MFKECIHAKGQEKNLSEQHILIKLITKSYHQNQCENSEIGEVQAFLVLLQMSD